MNHPDDGTEPEQKAGVGNSASLCAAGTEGRGTRSSTVVGATIPPARRDVPRHNQISIRLHLALEGVWHRIEAVQWSDRGFCFLHAQPLERGRLAFKRSLQHFDGELVWTRERHDVAQVTEMLLNEAIHAQANRMVDQPETQQRLLRLMRVQGMVDAKERVLNASGAMPDAARWQQLLQQRTQQALFQTGVRVNHAAWSAVVADALTLGGVVQDLERWSGSFQGG